MARLKFIKHNDLVYSIIHLKSEAHIGILIPSETTKGEWYYKPFVDDMGAVHKVHSEILKEIALEIDALEYQYKVGIIGRESQDA